MMWKSAVLSSRYAARSSPCETSLIFRNVEYEQLDSFCTRSMPFASPDKHRVVRFGEHVHEQNVNEVDVRQSRFQANEILVG